MRTKVVLLASTLLAGTFMLSSASAAILVNVDKSTQRMTVSRDGERLYTWPVSTGVAKHDTPAGKFTAFRMEEDHYSKEWDDAPMPHSIFFTKEGHAIHGSFHTKNLGRPASHGCVRLAPAHAAILFKLVKEEGVTNTKVVLSGQLPAGPVIAKRQTQDDEAEGAPSRQITPPQQQVYDAYGRPIYGGQAYARQQAPAYDSAPRYIQPRYGERPVYGERRYYYGDAPAPYGWRPRRDPYYDYFSD